MKEFNKKNFRQWEGIGANPYIFSNNSPLYMLRLSKYSEKMHPSRIIHFQSIICNETNIVFKEENIEWKKRCEALRFQMWQLASE
jgi:hypothetical protein